MIVGTAGHIDHGKTALVRALTGVDTDRLAEEKARGISIDLGFAYLPAPDGSVLGFVDVPGHERFMRNMLAGATGIDYALLVVAADDGVMPQTIEHLAVVDLLGIPRGVVALTKVDLIEPPARPQVRAEISAALAATCLANAEIIEVSSVTGEGIEDLRAHLFDAARDHGESSQSGRFRLAVDRSFTLAGAGTVVTGTVLSGSVAVGDHVVVSPSGLGARIRSIHAQNRPAKLGRTGERCALNLLGDGIAKDAIARGDIVLDPELHAPAGRIDAAVRILRGEPKPIDQWMPVRLHHAAAEVGARIVLLGPDKIPPGGEGLVQLVLERPIAAAVGDRFILRDTSSQRTIGGGRFIDLRAPARRRRTPQRLSQLAAHRILDPEKALAALLECPPAYMDLAAFARDRALAAAEIDAIGARLGLVRVPNDNASLALSAATWQRIKAAIAATLKTFHGRNPDLPGMGFEQLRLAIEPRLPTPGFAAALQRLAQEREIGLDGAWVRLVGHEVRLTPKDEALWLQIGPLLGGADRFRPPRVRDIATARRIPEADVRRLFKLLARMGKLHDVAPDHFFLRDTVAEMVAIAGDLASGASGGEFSAAQFRDRLDNGRKVAIQILEFFDRHGVTLRRGDLRRVDKRRLDLFRRSSDAGRSGAGPNIGREASPVGRPDFKSGKGRETVLGGFDPHSLPPTARGT